MAPRYTNKDKTKYLNRVKKLLAEGKTINGACTQVSEREEGRPSAHTLSLWVKAAGLTGDNGSASSNTSSNSTSEKTTSRRTKRGSANRRSKTAESSAETTTPAEPVHETEDPATAPADDTSATASAADVSSATEDSTTAAEDTTDSTAATAELIHIPSTTDGSTADSSLDLDDLIDENHRLRSALNEANRELRGLRDLVGVYVSR